jgi:hypothetical protein
MAFKPNYNQERRERSRVKDQRKAEKQQRRDEAAAKRKAEREGTPAAGDAVDPVEESR